METHRIFVAWRRLSERTKDIAPLLKANILFYPDSPPYIKAAIRTAMDIQKLRPLTVFLQLPQGPLLGLGYVLKKWFKFVLVTDVHSAMVVYDNFKSFLLNRPFLRMLRGADIVVVHNFALKDLIIEKVGLESEKVVVVYDPLPRIDRVDKPQFVEEIGIENYIVLPASWSADEPLEYIAREFCESKARRIYKLVVTGNYGRAEERAKAVAKTCGDVLLTGYLQRSQYNWLLMNAEIVIAATAREYTFLRSAWEAVAMNKPVLITRTKALEEVFGTDYPGFFKLDPGSLRSILDNIDIDLLQKTIKIIKTQCEKRQQDMLKELLHRVENLEQKVL